MSSFEDKNVGLGLLKALVENKYPFSYLERNEIFRKNLIGEDELQTFDLLEKYAKENKEALDHFEDLFNSESEKSSSILNALPNRSIEYWMEMVKARSYYNELIEKLKFLYDLARRRAIEKEAETILNKLESI